MRQTKRFAVVGSDARQAAAGRALVFLSLIHI